MSAMEAIGSIGHGTGISLQGQPRRKEWRAVIENSDRQRLVADNSSNQARIGTLSRLRTNAAPFRGRSVDDRQPSTGHSSDSEHHPADTGGPPLVAGAVSPRDLNPQSMGQGSEAVLYDEHGQQQNDCLHPGLNSISMDSTVSTLESQDDTLDQHIVEVSRQREQLQSAELELRARKVAHSEILRIQSEFAEQTKQHSDFVENLQEQIQKRDQQIHQLQQQLEERERELHTNQMETNEAVSQVWAKDGLLQQQTSELTTIRRERDNALAEQKASANQLDVEKAELMSQLENLKEQIRQKERHAQEMEEQHRTAQDMLLYKDEQLREAQAWIARAQELDVYHANANNALHAELRERTDQLNNLWLGYQRQLADVERYHTQIVQRMQMEVNEVKEQNLHLKGSSATDQTDVEDKKSHLADSEASSHHEYSDEAGGKGIKGLRSKTRSIFQNGSLEGAQLLLPEPISKVGVSTVQPLVPSKTLSTASVLPLPGPIAMRQYGRQSIAPTVLPSPSQVPEVIAQLQPAVAVLPSQQYLSPAHHQQVVHHQHQPQVCASLQRPASNRHHYIHAAQKSSSGQCQSVLPITFRKHLHQPVTGNDQAGQDEDSLQKPDQQFSNHPPYDQAQRIQQPQGASQGARLETSHPAGLLRNVDLPLEEPSHQEQVIQLLQNEQPPHDEVPVLQQRLQQAGDQGRQAQELLKIIDDPEHLVSYTPGHPNKTSSKQHLHNNSSVKSHQLQHQRGLFSSFDHTAGRSSSASGVVVHQDVPASIPDQADGTQSSSEAYKDSHATGPTSKEPGANGISAEPVLLDERSLLACLVRAVPAEATDRIRISSTLPNRLGKMLSPLHWHDYRKQFGRLDEFVTSHSELFILDGDFIHLREGARASISAKTAVARAAAAVAAGPIERFQEPVVVTPVAQLRGRSSKGSTSFPKTLKLGTEPEQDGVLLLPTSRTGTAQSPSAENHYPGPGGLLVDGHASHLYHSSGVSPSHANPNHIGKGDGDHMSIAGRATAKVPGGIPSSGSGTDVRMENGVVNRVNGTSRIHGTNSGIWGSRQQSR